MLTRDPKKRAEAFTKQIPALKQIPEQDRLSVFNKAFKSTAYKLFLLLIVVGFVLVFYFNLDEILNYKSLEHGGLLARSIHFLKILGPTFFLPLMGVFALLVLGRNYFVKKEVNKYLLGRKENKNSNA